MRFQSAAKLILVKIPLNILPAEMMLPRAASMRCILCGSNDAMLRHPLQKCARCGEDLYCGRRCQQLDWPRHRAEHSCGYFHVHVAPLSGETITIPACTEKLKVSALKEKISEKTGIEVFQQDLLLGTQVLCDNLSLREAGISADCSVTLLQEDRPPPMLASSDSEDGELDVKYARAYAAKPPGIMLQDVRAVFRRAQAARQSFIEVQSFGSAHLHDFLTLPARENPPAT